MSLSRYLFPVCYAVLAGIGLALPTVWWLAPLGFAAFLYDILFRTASARGALLRGALLGCSLGGAGVFWMWEMYPLQGASMGIASQYLLIALVWGITAALAALSSSLAALTLWFLRKNLFIAPAAALIWVVQEEARMWLYALYSFSPESFVGPHFSQTALGYVLAESPYFLQLAYPFGLPALTLATVILAAALMFGARSLRTQHLSAPAVLAYVCAGTVLLLPLLSTKSTSHTQPVSVAVLATTDTTSDAALQTLLEETASSSATFVLLPEGKIPSRMMNEPEYLSGLFRSRETLVMSARHNFERDGEKVAEITYESTGTGVIGIHRKVFLMPQGEYFPSIAYFLYPLSGDAHVLDAARIVGAQLSRGSTLSGVAFNGITVGGLLCSEVISPHLYHSLVREHGATVLVNLSNQSWFHGSRLFHGKMLQLAKMHAVRERRYYLQATNEAPSLIIDPHGEVVAQSKWHTSSVLYETIHVPN